MEVGEVIHNIHELVKEIENDTQHCRYFDMKAGIDVALGFLKAKVADKSITKQEYSQILSFVRNAVFDALTTE